MSSELVAILDNGIATYAPISRFANEELNGITEKIIELTQATKRNLMEIAVLLLKVDNQGLHKSAGFSKIEDYAEKTLGYKRAMTFKLVKTARMFIEGFADGYYSVLRHSERDYSVSQLMELTTIEREDAITLDNNGVITPDMTTKAIREAVKGFKNGEITAQGEDLQPDKSSESIVDYTNDETAETTGENVKAEISVKGELNAIIEHCENLLSIVADDKAIKKINQFKAFCMKQCSEYGQKAGIEIEEVING